MESQDPVGSVFRVGRSTVIVGKHRPRYLIGNSCLFSRVRHQRSRHPPVPIDTQTTSRHQNTCTQSEKKWKHANVSDISLYVSNASLAAISSFRILREGRVGSSIGGSYSLDQGDLLPVSERYGKCARQYRYESPSRL
jgi:hypothetical protein